MTTHILKCWPQFYDATLSGSKPFELRLDDRGFQNGDILILARTREDMPEEIEYEEPPPAAPKLDTRKPKYALTRTITYILHGPKFGLAAGYCIMGLGE